MPSSPCARTRATRSSVGVPRVLCRRDNASCFSRALHIWNDYPHCPCVEYTHYETGRMIWDTHQGRDARCFGRSDQVKRGIKAKRSVLEVEIHEVETRGGRHLYHIGGVGLNSNSQGHLTLVDRKFYGVPTRTRLSKAHMRSPHCRFDMDHSSTITVARLVRNSTLRKPCSRGAKQPGRCVVAVEVDSHDSRKAVCWMKNLIAVLEHPVNCAAIDTPVMPHNR